MAGWLFDFSAGLRTAVSGNSCGTGVTPEKELVAGVEYSDETESKGDWSCGSRV